MGAVFASHLNCSLPQICFTVPTLKHSAYPIFLGFVYFFLFASDFSTCKSLNRTKSESIRFYSMFTLSLQTDILFFHHEKTRTLYHTPTFFT